MISLLGIIGTTILMIGAVSASANAIWSNMNAFNQRDFPTPLNQTSGKVDVDIPLILIKGTVTDNSAPMNVTDALAKATEKVSIPIVVIDSSNGKAKVIPTTIDDVGSIIVFIAGYNKQASSKPGFELIKNSIILVDMKDVSTPFVAKTAEKATIPYF